jgi:hypothetical protein
MDYSKKKDMPHVEVEAGKEPVSAQVQGFKGPDEKWKGEVVDMNYGVVPTEKEAIQANLKKAGEDTITRFGLDQRGVEPAPYPSKD